MCDADPFMSALPGTITPGECLKSLIIILGVLKADDRDLWCFGFSPTATVSTRANPRSPTFTGSLETLAHSDFLDLLSQPWSLSGFFPSL